MARPKSNTVIEMPSNTDEAAEQAQREAQIRSTQLEIIVRDFGNNVPFSEVVYKDKIVSHLQRSAEELLEASKALYVTYEHIGGIYLKWGTFLREIGLEESLARRMIQTAKKFYKPETRPLIEKAGNKSKLFELLVLDDEEIVKVAQGAEDAPITLDEIDRMPTSELRKALREARADNEATKKVLEDKNKKMDKLEAELEKSKATGTRELPRPNYDILAVRTDLTQKTFEFDVVVKQIGAVLSQLQECDDEFAVQAKETLERMRLKCMSMADDLGLDFLNTESDRPAWMPSDEELDALANENE